MYISSYSGLIPNSIIKAMIGLNSASQTAEASENVYEWVLYVYDYKFFFLMANSFYRG